MRKCIFVLALIFLHTLSIPQGFSGQDHRYSLILKGGHVIDPANNINGKMDVAVTGNKIARISKTIPVSDAPKVIDVSGYYVTPGLIDMHVACYYTNLNVTSSVIPDHYYFQSGITTCVDGGRSGTESFEDFKKIIIDKSRVRVLAILNISEPGAGRSEQDPMTFNVKRAVEMAKKYPELILGYKSAHYMAGGKYDDAHPPWASVDSTLAAGKLAGLPCTFDFVPRPAQGKYPERSYREFVLKKLRPGDIINHSLAPRYPILLKNGKINPVAIEAKKRGVKFDLGHARASFPLRIIVPAVEQGFLPDTISSSLFSSAGVSLNNIMSKFICLGVPLEDVIRRTTVNPAQIINRTELGTLNVGADADIAVFEMETGKFSYRGTGYSGGSAGKIIGDKKLQCVLTVRNGNIVWDHPYGLSVPLWQDIPKDDQYWLEYDYK
ncbi:amidohydrolase family protein [Candidatus Latescibacterota bacterium]